MKQDWSCKTHIGRYIDGWFESQFLGICKKNAQDGIKGMTRMNSEKFQNFPFQA